MRSENFAKFVEYHTFDNNTTESDEFSDIGIVGLQPVSTLTYEGNNFLVVGAVSCAPLSLLRLKILQTTDIRIPVRAKSDRLT